MPPFDEMDAANRRQAPPVAAGVTAERLVRARQEPQNWLTYYGAYDGQRFSALDQINPSNIAPNLFGHERGSAVFVFALP